MTGTAASHKVAVKMIWLHFCCVIHLYTQSVIVCVRVCVRNITGASSPIFASNIIVFPSAHISVTTCISSIGTLGWIIEHIRESNCSLKSQF